jgi:uncharacterized membrane protein YgdD (TMEM256/DUF423 family)
MFRTFVAGGSLSAMLAVALGAFGAHVLKGRLSSQMIEVYQTAVLYHLVHAVGLVLVGLVAHLLPDSGPVRWAGWLLAMGTLLFSGSLYLLAVSGILGLGGITPFGGVAFLAGWAFLAVAVLSKTDLKKRAEKND